MAETFETDVLVVGAGMAGLTAGAWAAAQGAAVLVVERSRRVGGSAALSGGLLWTAPSIDVLQEENPQGDPLLGKVLVEDFPAAVEWVRSMGINVGPYVMPLQIPHGRGHVIDIIDYLERCRRAVLAADGLFVMDAQLTSLEIVSGRVAGGRVIDRDGETVVHAHSTVLCTGGFQCDAGMRAEHIAEPARAMLVRSNECSDGAGFRLGQAVGAARSKHMHGFYGHLIAHPLAREFEERDFVRLSQSIYSQYGVILGLDGRRFTDESRGYYRVAQALLHVPERRAVVIGDARIRRDYATQSAATGMEKWDRPTEAAAAGANVAEADEIADLCRLVAAWGYDRVEACSTMAEFNRKVVFHSDMLPVPRRRYRAPLREPRFFAVEVQPAITFTHGGLMIDDRGRVLDSADHPIPGLFAAGADAGSIFSEGYAGGLAVALVIGIRAAENAIEYG